MPLNKVQQINDYINTAYDDVKLVADAIRNGLFTFVTGALYNFDNSMTVAGSITAVEYYIDDTLSEDGNPSLRLEFDDTTGEYDWMLSRGVQVVAGEYELGIAGNSPAGVFFHGENTGNGLAILAAGNHNSLAAGTILPRPENFSPGASVRVTGLTGYIDLITNGTTRARVSDANFQIDDLLVTGNTTLKKITETKVALSGTTPAVDLDNGTVFTHTVATSANTFTFTNPGAVTSFTLIITNGESQVVNWPASVKWAGGTKPTLTVAGVDILTFVTPDAGTTWYGFVGGLDMQ